MLRSTAAPSLSHYIALMDPAVDRYVARSKKWPEVLVELRPLLLACGLDEAIKWGKPCYSHNGHNVAIIQEMSEFVSLMFFKGALLDDAKGLLVDQGPNSRSAKRIEIDSAAAVKQLTPSIRALLKQAIKIEDEGRTVGPAPELELVQELRDRLAADEALRAAFFALTPGRRREYHLHIADAKQATTRLGRLDRCVPKILAGKGFRD
jgi:uncharacterized protein YdeI (YjbR/CyaY-like superfamily)